MVDDYRSQILNQLKTRNAKINDGYAPLIKAYNELLDFVIALQVRRGNSRRTRRDRVSEGETTANDQEASDTITGLENKIAHLQTELTELFRRRSENAQELIDANNKLKEKDAEIIAITKKWKQAQDSVSALLEAKRNLEQRIEELTANNMQILDELVALQSMYAALEAKYRTLTQDNGQLLQKCKEFKEKEVEVMNLQAELQMRMQELQLQNQLADAVRQQITVPSAPESSANDTQMVIPVCVGASIPTRCKFKIEAHENEVFCVSWSPTGRYFATGGADRKIKLWTLEGERCTCSSTLTGCNQSVSCLDFDAEEAHVMAGSFDYAIRIWSLSDQRLRHSLSGHSAKVMATRYMGTSSARAVSGSYDRTIKIWDLRTRSCIHTFFPGSSCNDLVVSEGAGAGVISGHFDKKLRFYDVRTSDPLREMLLDGKITSLSLSMDKMYLLCCTREDVLHYFDLRTYRSLHNYSADSFKLGFDYSRAVLSPDGQFCAVGSSDGQLFTWNVMSGKLEKILGRPGSGSIIACAWHPNGQMIATCDKHRTVSVWSDY